MFRCYQSAPFERCCIDGLVGSWHNHYVLGTCPSTPVSSPPPVQKKKGRSLALIWVRKNFSAHARSRPLPKSSSLYIPGHLCPSFDRKTSPQGSTISWSSLKSQVLKNPTGIKMYVKLRSSCPVGIFGISLNKCENSRWDKETSITSIKLSHW